MVEHASDSEHDYTQKGCSDTLLSKKPSTCVFDPNRDTRIVLRTSLAMSFHWSADELLVFQVAPANEIRIDSGKVTFTNFGNEEPSVPDYQDGKIDAGDTETGANSDSTDPTKKDSDDQEICEPGPERTEVCMLVSGKHLELALLIFKTVVTGPFTEG